MTTATALEVKDDILLMLAGAKDVSKLKKVREAIAAILWSDVEVTEEEEKEDWWEMLPKTQQQRLLLILDEMKSGKFVEDENWDDFLTSAHVARLRQAERDVLLPENQVPHEEVMDFLKTGKRYATNMATADPA